MSGDDLPRRGGPCGRLTSAVGLATLLLVANPAHASTEEGDWRRQIAGLIMKKQSYPRSAQLRGAEGTATVRITVTATGAIAGVSLEKSSGHEILDHEALRTLTRIEGFPPPPGGPVSLVLPMTWRLG